MYPNSCMYHMKKRLLHIGSLCAQGWPTEVAFLTPVQTFTGAGLLNLRLPTGGAAYLTPVSISSVLCCEIKQLQKLLRH